MSWTRRLRLQHLKWLVSLAETGSISEAARACFSTQPALSKWLKDLEESIGAPLFERHARGLNPTAHGLTLLAHARRVLSEMERARHNLDTLQGTSTLRVAIGTSAASVRIPRSSGHPFHEHLTTDSTLIRPPIPRASGH